VETHDDEGRIDVMSESRMCEFLGLTEEGTTYESTNVPTQGFGCRMDEQVNDTALGQDIDGAAIPLVMPYPVRWSLHMIRRTHQWR
jgi:hypothetical protein